MKSSWKIKHQFSFPPKNQEDMKIMKYIEFLEIEVYNNPESSEILYSVTIDPKTIRCSPKFLEFIKDCGHYETINGLLGDIFKHSCEGSTDLLFFSAGTKYFLIDREGYIHLGTIQQEVTDEDLKFIVAVLKECYEFKIYEENFI